MLAVTHLRKTYDRVVAVDDVSLTVQRGELFGLLGPNGAGKTTAIRTILNVIEPDSGAILFDGRPFTPEMWNRIGYLPEERGLYRKSKILNTILYFAALKGVPAAQAKPAALYWLERFGLKGMGQRKIEELSKGNQQKVQLVCSILHKPELLILDEPFSGLDPVNQILLKDILLELRQQNIAIVFSTHQMEQVEKMCDNICLINKGRIVLEGNLREVKKRYGKNSVHVEFDGDGGFLRALPQVRSADVYQNYAELEITDQAQTGSLLSAVSARVNVRKYELVEPSLQSIFVGIVGIPKTDETVAPPVAVQASRRPMSADERKALLSTLVVLALAVVFGIREASEPSPQWLYLALWPVLVLVAAFRFWQARRKAEAAAAAPFSPIEPS